MRVAQRSIAADSDAAAPIRSPVIIRFMPCTESACAAVHGR